DAWMRASGSMLKPSDSAVSRTRRRAASRSSSPAPRTRSCPSTMFSATVKTGTSMNIKSEPIWRNGSFTNPDPEIRERAVTYLTTAMDLAADLVSDMVTMCPLMDGWDYSFQVDYIDQWRWLVDGLKRALDHRSD